MVSSKSNLTTMFGTDGGRCIRRTTWKTARERQPARSCRYVLFSSRRARCIGSDSSVSCSSPPPTPTCNVFLANVYIPGMDCQVIVRSVGMAR